MGRIAAFLFWLCAAGSAWAADCPADITKCPSPSYLNLTVGKTLAGGAARNNAALKAITVGTIASGTSVYRSGFTTPGDGGAADYTFSTSPCSLNAGAGDNGSQVSPTAGTGCWIADFAGMQVTPMIWGAVGDGVANDYVAVQSAMTAMGGKTLFSGAHSYLVSTGVVLPAHTGLIDTRGMFPGATNPSFRAGALNMTLLTIQSNSFVHGIVIDMGAPGLSTTGAGISARNVNNTLIEAINVYQGCLGADVGGNTLTIAHSLFQSQNGTGCGGMRIGDATTGANNVDLRLEGNTISTLTNASFGMKIEDAGGLLIDNMDVLFAQIGVWVVPGVNQEIAWFTATNSYLGDTTGVSGVVGTSMLIDTADPSAKIFGMQFTGTWTSNSQFGPGLKIQNTGGGDIEGIHLNGHRFYLNRNNGMEIATPVSGTITDITIDNSSICGTQNGTDLLVGVGVSGVSIRNNKIGKDCDGLTIGSVNPTYGVAFSGSNSDVIFTGNDLSGLSSPTFGTPTGQSIVGSNINQDTQTPSPNLTITSSTINLTLMNPIWHLTGTTAITTINGGWISRPITFVTDTGAVAFNTGGNIKSAVTSAGAGAAVTGFYDGTFWYLK